MQRTSQLNKKKDKIHKIKGSRQYELTNSVKAPENQIKDAHLQIERKKKIKQQIM